MNSATFTESFLFRKLIFKHSHSHDQRKKGIDHHYLAYMESGYGRLVTLWCSTSATPMTVFNNVLNNINAFSSTVKAQARMIDKLYAKMIETVEAKCTE